MPRPTVPLVAATAASTRARARVPLTMAFQVACSTAAPSTSATANSDNQDPSFSLVSPPRTVLRCRPQSKREAFAAFIGPLRPSHQRLHPTPPVTLGLVPRVHSGAAPSFSREVRSQLRAWIAGTRPGNDNLRRTLGSRETATRDV